MYKTELLKKKYFEEKIIKDFIESDGIIPSRDLVKKKIDSLNLSIPLTQPYNIKVGDKLNSERYSNLLSTLQSDLTILYDVIKDYSLNDYYYLMLYIKNNLNEIQKQVEKYKEMAKQFDYLGKTLLFTDEFDYEDNIINISNSLSIKDNAHLLFNINGLNFDLEPELIIEKNGKIIINKKITKKDTYIKIEGPKIKPKKYMYQLSNYKVNQIELDSNKIYSIYDGRNKILINDKPKDIPLEPILMLENSEVKFYSIDNSRVSINADNPGLIKKKNFSWFDNITNDYIYMLTEKDAKFSIGNIGGSIYAKNYRLNNTKTFDITNPIDSSLLILEYDEPIRHDYNIYIKLPKDKRDTITNIFIKEQ